jgi:hypothetical protein
MFLLSSIKINKISYCLASNTQLSVYIVKIEDNCDQLEHVILMRSIYMQQELSIFYLCNVRVYNFFLAFLNLYA